MRLETHGNPIFSLAFNPVAPILAAGDYNGEIGLWQLDSGKRLAIFPPTEASHHGGSLVAFSPDGSTLAAWPVNTPSQFILWHLPSQQTIARFECPYINRAVWSPDGRWLAGAESQVTVRDGKTGELLQELPGYGGTALSLVWSADGQLLATGGDSDDSHVRIWDIEKGQQIATYRPTNHVQNVESVAFYGSDKLVYIDDSDQPHLWSWRTDPEPHVIHHGARIPNADNYPTQLDRTGRYIARIDPKDYRILYITDLETGNQSTFFAEDAHAEVVSRIVFSPNSQQVATGDFEGIIYVWDVSPPSCLRQK